MTHNDLSARRLGLPPEDLGYVDPSGDYEIELRHHRGAIWLVRERGWAGDAAGQELVALFVRLLDAVEREAPGARIYLCSDYRDYRGSSNATRKAMLREVVMRSSLGAVAFWGAGFITRSVAMLLSVALPRLATKPFQTQAQALAFLEELERAEAPTPSLEDDLSRDVGTTPAPFGEGIDDPEEPSQESLDAAVLASFLLRNSEYVAMETIGDRRRRVVRPPDWGWRPDGPGPGMVFALVDDEVIWGSAGGPVQGVPIPQRKSLVHRTLDDLGLRRVSYVLDLRDQPTLPPGPAAQRVAFFRANAPRLLHVVVVGDAQQHRDIEPLLHIGSAPLDVRPVFPDLDSALLALDRARQQRLCRAEQLTLPEDRAELQQLTLDLHRSLREHRLALQRLFSFVGRVSWDESYLRDEMVVPEDVTASNPYWSLYGALHMMQHDMLEVLREREARNRELALAREQAEAANRAKSQFLGTVSHELRTPLNAIFGMVDLLRAQGLEGDALRQLDGIQSASRQLLRLVADLLDIARIEEGVFGLEPAPYDLIEGLEQLCGRFAPLARSHGLELQRHLAPGLPRTVRVDGVRLLQVLGNLLDNAIKFTPRGWVRLSVAPCPGGVRFEVIDSGKGIAPDDLPFVFERFQRGEHGRTDVLPGVGLGLAICRQLVALMGGEIQVESEQGMGSCFVFELPLVAVMGEPPAAPPPQVMSAPTGVDPGEREVDFSDLLVLLVEDDPPSRYVARHLLESLGVEVVEAEDGREALERLMAGCYDLVLMDCQMPYMDGLEVTRRFRRQELEGRHTPIVALTAYAFDEDRERALAAGMDDHEAKPVSRARFEALLRRYALERGP
jgi:signal transduction histidine kinase/ActR/RegA family two-component response regulator